MGPHYTVAVWLHATYSNLFIKCGSTIFRTVPPNCTQTLCACMAVNEKIISHGIALYLALFMLLD